MLRLVLSLSILISHNGFGQDPGKRIPFKLINNHIYLEGVINDTLKASILLDCGAGTMISDEMVKKGNIPTHSPGNTDGVGNELVPYKMTDSIVFNLGNIRYSEKRIPVLSFKEIADCGANIRTNKEGRISFLKKTKNTIQPIDAVLGDKFFRKFVIKLDFQNQVLTLFEPSTFEYSGKGDRISLLYIDNHIYTRASIPAKPSPVSGYFMVDCGSMTGVVLNVSFQKKHKIHSYTKATEISVCGIGGRSRAIMGSLTEIKIGKQRIKKPVTIFSQATGGVLTRPDVAGSIGNGILRKFNVIFDYSRSEMILD